MDEQTDSLDLHAEMLYNLLYDHTARSRVTGQKTLLANPPGQMGKETLTALLAPIGTGEVHPTLENIAAVRGKKDIYYYEKTIMTKHYAELDALLQDKDILRTIATVTRSDSRLYPRPTQYSKLMNVPFRFTMDEILGAAARMQLDEEYKDIGVVTASNGKSAFYSDKHLSKRYAQSLLEFIEVEGPENP